MKYNKIPRFPVAIPSLFPTSKKCIYINKGEKVSSESSINGGYGEKKKSPPVTPYHDHPDFQINPSPFGEKKENPSQLPIHATEGPRVWNGQIGNLITKGSRMR